MGRQLRIAGHNRGTNCYFGDIHNLNVGDTITLTTRLGTRTYSVTSVNKISETDKIDGKRHQQVDIYYSTIGLWTAPEPETLEREYMAYYQAMQKRKKRTA